MGNATATTGQGDEWMTFSLKIAVFLSSTHPQTLMNPMCQDMPLAWGSGGRRFKSSRPDQADEWTRGKLPVIASELAFGFSTEGMVREANHERVYHLSAGCRH